MKFELHCLSHADLCEDIEIKQQIVEIIETVRNRHRKVIREGGASLSDRRRSSARRFSIVVSHSTQVHTYRHDF